jgi:hypothetical protein
MPKSPPPGVFDGDYLLTTCEKDRMKVREGERGEKRVEDRKNVISESTQCFNLSVFA